MEKILDFQISEGVKQGCSCSIADIDRYQKAKKPGRAMIGKVIKSGSSGKNRIRNENKYSFSILNINCSYMFHSKINEFKI